MPLAGKKFHCWFERYLWSYELIAFFHETHIIDEKSYSIALSLSSLQRIDLWDFPHLTELKMKNKDKVCCLDLDRDDSCDIAGYLDHCQQHLSALLSTSTHPA